MFHQQRIIPCSLIILIALGLFGFGFAAPSRAESIQVEHSLGFSGLFKLHDWAPLNITIGNTGRPLKGSIEVTVTSGSEYFQNVRQVTYAKALELPTNSRKIYSFTVLIDSYAHPLLIRIKRDRDIIYSDSINLRPHYTTDRLAVFIGPGTAAEILPALPGGLKAVHVRTELLPETWYGYGGVEAVAMRAGELKTLRESQFSALKAWAGNGGLVIFPGEVNYGVFSLERTRSLLPVRVSGLEQKTEISSFKQFCGEKLTSTAPFLVLNAEISGGEILLSENSTPLIIRKDFGLGKMVFLAFDVQAAPFSAWTGKHAFWTKMLTLKPAAETIGLNLTREDIISLITSGLSFRVPRFITGFFFLLGYLVVIWLIFILLEQKKTRRNKYLVRMLAVITVFSLPGLALYARHYNLNRLDCRSFTHLRMSGESTAAGLKSMVGLYSLKGGDYRIDLGPGNFAVEPVGISSGGDRIRRLILSESPLNQAQVSFDRWSHGFFEIKSSVSFPLKSRITLDSRGLTVVLQNMTPFSIVEGRFFYKDRFYEGGTIPPDGRLFMKLAVEKAGRKNEATGPAPWPPGASPSLKNIRDSLTPSLVNSAYTQYSGKDDVIYFFAWMNADILPLRLAEFRRASDQPTLLEWTMTVPEHDSLARANFSETAEAHDRAALAVPRTPGG